MVTAPGSHKSSRMSGVIHFIDSLFMPCTKGDRPDALLQGASNLAFFEAVYRNSRRWRLHRRILRNRPFADSWKVKTMYRRSIIRFINRRCESIGYSNRPVDKLRIKMPATNGIDATDVRFRMIVSVLFRYRSP